MELAVQFLVTLPETLGRCVVARRIVRPEIPQKWSIVWTARGQSAAIERVLDTARRCATEKDWLPAPNPTAAGETESSSVSRD